MKAASKGNPGVVEELLRREDVQRTVGAQSSAYKWTALHSAANRCSFAVVERLLQADVIRWGLDVNARDYSGQTALMLAVRNGDEQSVRLMMGYKVVRLDIADDAGHNAVKHALEMKNETIMRVLILEWLARSGVDLGTLSESRQLVLCLAESDGTVAATPEVLLLLHSVRQLFSYPK
ncbi:Ankyrin repeat-containing domain protein, partial [Metarhizium hybridum]